MLLATKVVLLLVIIVAVNADRSRLHEILTVQENLLLYVQKHYDKLNLDGIIGVRETEGQVGSLLARYWTQLPFWVVSKMRHLQSIATGISNAAVPIIAKKTPKYFKIAHKMITSNFWSMYYPESSLNTELIFFGQRNESQFDEEFSDKCIGEFYATNKRPACQISKRCWFYMAMPLNYEHYALTHQVFYLLNGIQANCLENLTKMALKYFPTAAVTKSSNREIRLDHPVRALLDFFCANIYMEATKYYFNDFPMGTRDLFMEQVGLCGLAGYTEIANWLWWPYIKSWQRNNGCYGSFPEEQVASANFEKASYGNSRKKRVESLMSGDGCLSHRSSVALFAVISYLRRDIESKVSYLE